MTLTLAIVGRPNVGKSTLFNRLAGRQLAIVHDRPGVTRDWREAQGSLFGVPLHLIDTAGLEDAAPETLSGRMRARTVEVLDTADAILFVVDGRAGVLPADAHFAGWLRRRGRPVFLIVNKAENEKAVATAMAESHALGLGDPVAVSAAHGTGLEDLYHVLSERFPAAFSSEDDSRTDLPEGADGVDGNIDALEGAEDFDFTAQETQEEDNAPIRIALAGRPNVGKSTLLNAILKEERVVTSPEAGTTRDAIAVDWDHEGTRFRLVDTAGLRKQARIIDPLEKMAIADTMRAIRLARIVVLVVDATRPLEKQDLVIAGHVADEGRAMVLALNK
ncbi:MAG TPA: ribosome biogenesis GTPase Der, partial [Alphaproteobacteria bacterium]|nr:ribosome biogenesis GTPase Der [Alphaproteobacteria bacterium]